MAKFVLFFDTNNAAFDENRAGEVSRILADIAAKIEGGVVPQYFQTIRDINGNDIGRYAVKPDDYTVLIGESDDDC